MMSRSCFRLAMTRWGTSEEPDFTPEWKKTLIGVMISAGLILIFVGAMLLTIAAITEFSYQTMTLPPDVRGLVDTTLRTSYTLLAVGGGLIVIGYIARL